MRQLSLILNAVLLVAVGVLYYLHFSKPSASATEVSGEDSVKTQAQVELPEIRSVNGPIAFINSEVLDEKYDFIKESQAKYENYFNTKEQALKQKEAKWRDDAQKLTEEAQAQRITEEQYMARAQELQQRQNDLLMEEQNLQKELKEKTEQNYKEILKNVDDYLREQSKEKKYAYVFTYSKGSPATIVYANDSLEITNQVVNGLNNKYREGKKKKK